MKTQLRLAATRTALGASLAALFVGGSMSPLAAQVPAKQTTHSGSHVGQPHQASKDYLVQQGKHVMWKSQLEIMHPELARKATPLSKRAGNDYLVQVGKTSVLASTLRRAAGPKSTRPAPHGMACKDYIVQSGKKIVWASEIGAPCPAGPHKGEQKPLCCIVSLDSGKDLKPCCRDAQG